MPVGAVTPVGPVTETVRVVELPRVMGVVVNDVALIVVVAWLTVKVEEELLVPET